MRRLVIVNAQHERRHLFRRAIAGDIQLAGMVFIPNQPFIWRRTLLYVITI